MQAISEALGSIDELSANIVATYDLATDDERANGETWYELAHLFAAQLSPRVERSAGVIAALSPQCSWAENVKLAHRAFRVSERLYGQTRSNIAKAERILRGDDPLDILGGAKVRAFLRLHRRPSQYR